MPRKIKVVDVINNDNNEAVVETIKQPELIQENNEQIDTIENDKIIEDDEIVKDEKKLKKHKQQK